MRKRKVKVDTVILKKNSFLICVLVLSEVKQDAEQKGLTIILNICLHKILFL